MVAVAKPVYKECSTCKRSFETETEYKNSTSFVGVVSTGKYSDKDLELRNCSCGSTLATYHEEEEAAVWPKVKRVK